MVVCDRTTRLNKAAALLLLSTRGVKQIAHAVGFRSVSHFVQAFKSAFGATPRQYPLNGDDPSFSDHFVPASDVKPKADR